MKLNAIITKEEIWLPEMIRVAGVARVLKPKDLLCAEGIIIPRQLHQLAYSAFEEGKIAVEGYGRNMRLDILTPSNVLASYRIGEIGTMVCDLEHIPDDYPLVIGDQDYGLEMSVVASYLFAKGKLKDVKSFLTQARKHFHMDAPMVCYKLADLEVERQKLYGETRRCRRPWEFK